MDMAILPHTVTVGIILRGILFLQLPFECVQGASNFQVTTTQYSIELTCKPESRAVNYTAKLRMSSGFDSKSKNAGPPYDGATLNFTYFDALPGTKYSVQLLEDLGNGSSIVFEREVATVPLQPTDIRVLERGINFLQLQWKITDDGRSEGHKLHYKRENGTWQMTTVRGVLIHSLLGLEPGYMYQIYLVAFTMDKESQASDNVSNSTVPVPPTNIGARALNSATIQVNWTPNRSSFQEKFQIRYSKSGSPNDTTNCTYSPCSFSPGPPAGQVVAIFLSSLSHGDISAWVKLEHSTAPGKVTNVTAIEGVASVNLSWTAPEGSIQENYVISLHYRDETQNFTVPSSQLSKRVDSLKGGYTYSVAVRAVTKYAEGDADTHVFVPVPEPVTGLSSVAINTTAINISWILPVDSQIGYLNVTIFQNDVNVVFIKEVGKDVRSRIVTDLSPGVQYTVKVSVHSDNTAIPSPEAVGQFRTKPDKPRILSKSSEENNVTIYFNASQDGGSFDSIRGSLQEQAGTIVADTQGRMTISNLTAGTQYQVDVYSMSGLETSDKVLVNLTTKPRPPTNLKVVTDGKDKIIVTWEAPGVGGFDNFTVHLYNADKVSQVVTTSHLKADFEGLLAGITYNVSARTKKGDQSSDEVVGVNTTVPLAVTRIRVSSRGYEAVTISWDAPVGSGLSGYALTFEPSNLTLLSLPKETTQYKLEGLKAGGNYSLFLYAYARRPTDNTLLYSSAAPFNFVTYPDTVAAIQKVSASSDNITVNWTAPVSISVDSYQIRIESVDFTTRPMEQPRTLPKNITNTTFSNLEPGFAYTISIRTVTAQGQFGPVVRFRAVTKPLPVENLEISAINTTALRVKWSLNRSSKQNITQVTYGNMTRQVAVSNQSEFSMELTNLEPGEAYNITVISVRANESDEERSLEMTRQGFTHPSPVRNLTLTYTRDTLLVTWGQPSGAFGGFQLFYRNVLREPQSNFMYREYRLATARSATISNLFHGEKYQVVLTSVSHGLNSSEVAGDIVIDPLPPKDLTLDPSRTTTSNIRLQWSYNYEETYVEKWIVQVKEGLGVLVERGSDTFYGIDLDQLAAGQTYNVSVKSQVMNQVSREVSITVTTKPLMNSLLKEESSTNSSITLSYTVMEADTFDKINFTLLSHQFVDFVVKEKTDRSRTVTFMSLAAGTKYTVQAVTVSKSESSGPVTIDIFTDPLPVPVQFTSTAKEVSMKLGPQIGTASAYAIYCSTQDNTGCGEKIVQASTDLPPVVFADLQSYHIYKFRVITMTGILHLMGKNVTMDYEYRTAESPPGPVRMLTAKDRDLHSVELTWQPPAAANGEIKNYIISYYGQEPTDPEIKDAEKVVNVPTLFHTLTDLRAGFKYTFKVAAVTIEKGEDTQLDLTMKTAAPVFKASLSAETSRPQPATDKDKSLVSQNQIKLEIVDPFSTENGYIRYYTVVVAMNKDSKDQSSPLPSWSEAKKDKTIKVYQAENCTDLFTPGSTCGTIATNTRGRRAASAMESRQFVLGADLDDDCVEKKYCNGPLTADTTYFVKLRGYTASGEYQETAYSEAIKTAEGPAVNQAATIGGIMGAIVIVAIISVVVVVMVARFKKRPKRATKLSGPKSNWEQSTMSRFSRPVKLADFPSHVKKMSSDSDFKYAEEYEDLKEVGRDQPCSAAEFPPNRPKNRFTNILPYDHSRVKLLPTDDEEGSDYINANYMPGYNSKREYIATQGPLPSTRDDFWRMIWEQNSRNIVMLTRCHEKGREKSDHYWPADSEPKFYGDLQVLILNETHMPDWTITEFKVSHGENSKNVRHFYYLVWPDFGVPKNPTSLIRFVRTVREKLIREGGPIVTHCSAGVGRSGTFIVLDHILQLIREHDEVDIFSLVYKLRKERVLMVQTEQQYKFIHECLMCVLEGREEDMTYANVGQINVGFEDEETDFGINMEIDDEGINVETN